MNKNFKAIQLNLMKSKTATNELIGQMLINQIDVALIQEPYCYKTSTGYKVPSAPGLKTISIGSGKILACIIVNEQLVKNTMIVPQLSNSNMAACHIEFKGRSIVVASVYVQPYADIRTNIPELQKLVDYAERKNIIIGGDFNAHSEIWFDRRNDGRSLYIEEFVLQNNLSIANRRSPIPTYQSIHGESNIDITLVDGNLALQLQEWKVCDTISSSDHNPIEMIFDFGGISNINCFQKNLDTSQISTAEIERELGDLHIAFDNNFPDLNSMTQIDNAIAFVYNKINSLVNKYGKTRKIFPHRPEWWTTEVEMSRKEYLEKKNVFYKNKIPQYTRVYYDQMMKNKDKFKEKIEKARIKAWNNLVGKDFKNNPWGLAYKLAAEKFHGSGILASFLDERNEITRDISSSMTYLLNRLLPDNNNNDTSQIHNQRNRDYMAIVPTLREAEEVTTEELNEIIGNLKNKKAPGLDQLRSTLVKKIHLCVGPVIRRIYNACLDICYFPRSWKKGNLVVLLKNPEKEVGDIGNYRPITLLPEYGKILEKLIKSRLSKATEPLHSDNQYGFIRGRSTTDAIRKYVRNVAGTTSKYCATIFVDIKGAFDNVWWPGIIFRLRQKNTPNHLVAIIKSYLEERKVIFCQGMNKVEKTCTKGCPQGSVLGPTLWNITMDALLEKEWQNGVEVIAYADDLAITVKANQRMELKRKINIVLDLLVQWAAEYRMSISTKKTKIMINRSPARVHNRDMIFKINGEKLELVKTHKYLGIIIDPVLTFEANAKHAIVRTRKLTMALRKKLLGIRTVNFGTRSLRTIYRCAVLPILRYGAAAWYHRLNKTKIARQYQSIHGTMSRLMANCYSSVSTEAAGVLAGILPTDLQISYDFCKSELKRGRSCNFQGEHIAPEMFDSIRHALEYVKIKAEDIWQDRWDRSEKGRNTYHFMPTVPKSEEEIPSPERERIQFLTGHGEFGCHLVRIGKVEDGTCSTCPGSEDTPLHRLMECPDYEEARQKIAMETGVWPLPLQKVPYLEDAEIFKILVARPNEI